MFLGQINSAIKEQIHDMYADFVAEVNAKEVFDLLIQERIIDIHHKQEFMNNATPINICRNLLDWLLNCSNNKAFIVLREALKKSYPWIVDNIDEGETKLSFIAPQIAYKCHFEQPVHLLEHWCNTKFQIV